MLIKQLYIGIDSPLKLQNGTFQSPEKRAWSATKTVTFRTRSCKVWSLKTLSWVGLRKTSPRNCRFTECAQRHAPCKMRSMKSRRSLISNEIWPARVGMGSIMASPRLKQDRRQGLHLRAIQSLKSSRIARKTTGWQAEVVSGSSEVSSSTLKAASHWPPPFLTTSRWRRTSCSLSLRLLMWCRPPQSPSMKSSTKPATNRTADCTTKRAESSWKSDTSSKATVAAP